MVARRPHDCPTHPSVGHGLGSACCRASSGGLATGHETAWFRLALYLLLRAHCNALLHLLLTVAHPFRRCSVALSKPWHLSNRSIQNCAGQPNLSKPIELSSIPRTEEAGAGRQETASSLALWATLCKILAMNDHVRITIAVATVLRVFLEDTSQPRYGYELMRLTGYPSGKLYPLLARLERAGWLTKELEDIDPAIQGRPARRLYRISEEGARAARYELAMLSTKLQPPNPKPGQLRPEGGLA